MKKTIKIGFIGFWKNFKPETSIFYKILSKKYDIEISEEPDYLFCSVLGTPYEYCKYNAIRIMVSLENYIPDFNLIDYGASSYPLTLQDRHFHAPCSLDEKYLMLGSINRNFEKKFLRNKEFFANFICSHESENNIRGDFFKKLCEYKRVESAGTYLNNMPNGEVVNRAGKKEFQSKCKFTLCFESTKHEGFITEKIADAFLANTIPVYYGSSDVGEIFNKKAFIDVSDYATFDDAINKIIELDNDDEKYLEMLRQPILVNLNYFNDVYKNLENFLKNIFDQPIEQAYRRSRVYSPLFYNNYLVKLIKGIDVNNNTSKRKLKKKKFISDLKYMKQEKGEFFAFLYWVKHLGGKI